jgi:hypothetical protein
MTVPAKQITHINTERYNDASVGERVSEADQM